VFFESIGEYAIDSAWHLPLGPLTSLAVLALAVRRAARAAMARGTATPSEQQGVSVGLA
jgi:hypothetical protein